MDRANSGVSSARALLATAALALAALAASMGSAGVPTHPPGTVCYTPRFWCKAVPVGPPGSPCICRTAAGPVAGVRG